MTDFRPTPAQLEDFLGGNLDDATMDKIGVLIDDGKITSEELDRIAAKSTLVRSISESVRESNESSDVLPGLIDDVTRTFHGLKTIPEAAENPVEFPPEHRLGPYVLKEAIGHGGMSTVYRAHDEKLQRDVAVKVLSPGLSAVDGARERFLREARAAARLEHDHVLPIHTVSVDDSPPWLAMPLVKGMSLEQKLADTKGPLPIDDVRGIGIEIARGLAAAHEAGLVHRDIKPGNILLDEKSGRALVTDFGLARAAEEARLTSPDGLAGTPQFMSPEQINSDPVTPASDLFSFGSVLYTMLAGRPPFEGSSASAVMKSITDAHAKPLREVAPDTPKWLAALIDRLLERDPAHRPGSATEVARLLEERSAPGGASRKIRQLRVAAAIAAVLALAAALFAGLEKSGRTNIVNGFLARSSQHPCSIRGQWGTFATLPKAIEAAQPNARIDLYGTTPLVSPAFEITKPLTIASAHGQQVTIRHDTSEGPFVTISAPVTFDGIIFQQTPRNQRQRALLHVENGHLRLLNGGLGYTDRSLRIWRTRSAVALIRVMGESRVEVEDSVLFSMNGAAILSRSTESSTETHDIQLRRCAVSAYTFFAYQSRSASLPVSLHLEQSTFSTRDLLQFPAGSALPRLLVRGSRNVFESLALVASESAPAAEGVAAIDWKLDDNLFAVFEAIIREEILDRKRRAGNLTLESLHEHWPQSDSNSTFIPELGINRALLDIKATVSDGPSIFAIPEDFAEGNAHRGFPAPAPNRKN